MRKESSASSASHAAENTHQCKGVLPAAYTTEETVAAAAGIGKPTKYLRSDLPGFFGIGFLVMLKRARRAAPHNRNTKEKKYPARRSCSSVIKSVGGATNWMPHANASTAGAMPKLMQS